MSIGNGPIVGSGHDAVTATSAEELACIGATQPVSYESTTRMQPEPIADMRFYSALAKCPLLE